MVNPLNCSVVESNTHSDNSTIAISNRQRTKRIDLRLLKKITAAALSELAIWNWQLEIVLLGARKMAQVNRQFLGHEGSTDVVTFDYGDCGVAGCPRPVAKAGATGTSRPTLHGEIFICVDEAIRQARKFRTSWQSEIVRYLVHGILHLLGHDDLQTGERQKMKRIEGCLLRQLSRRFSLAQLNRPAKLPACKNR